MKKRNLMMVTALSAFGMMAQAQVVATLGFEDGDKQFYNPDSAQFATFYADHINLMPGDVWDEKCTDAHSGTYALKAANSNTEKGQTWYRGFKMRNLEIKPQTPYRVSFWVKAASEYTMEDGTKGETSIKSTLSMGVENFEAPLVSQSGTEYYYNYTSGMTNDWRKIAFVVYNSGYEVQNSYAEKYAKNIKDIIVNDPEDVTKNDTIYWGDVYMGNLPEKYFLTINMYNPGEYLLDDILIEEGATIAGCTYNFDAIRIDFGYPTNLAELAKASTSPMGTLSLPTSCVKVKNGSEELEVSAVEGKEDGYLYIFMADESVLEENEGAISVSFTPDADCPIKYTTDRRPSMDVEGEMVVLPFENEAITQDLNIDVLPSAWDAPIYLSSVPENESFELVSEELKSISLTYNKALDLSSASASLMMNGVVLQDLSDAMTLSDDGCTVIVALDNLNNGEYTLVVEGVANSFGIAANESQKITFAVGEDTDTSVAEDVYCPDWSTLANGTFPVGWLSNDNGTIHQYGLTDDGQVWNYNWGGNIGGGGCRAMTGYSGDFNGGALYWRASGGTEGTCTFGEQVKDNILPDGTIDPEMDPNIALYLEARKYQISFRMAAWKFFENGEAPTYNFALTDLDGNVYAEFRDYPAKPNVNGQQNMAVNGATQNITDFTVPKAGYYVLKFYCQSQGGLHEFLLGNVKLITMPSKASYYKGLLKAEVEAAKAVLLTAEDAAYDGTTKTALSDAIKKAEETHFTSPTAVEALIGELKSLSAALTERITNIDSFTIAIVEAETAMDAIVGTKYEATDIYTEYSILINDYKDMNPSALDDATLKEVTPKLVQAKDLLNNAQSCADALTWRIYRAADLGAKLGISENLLNEANVAVTDDDELVARLNRENKIKLYEYLANNAVIGDEMKTTIKSETETNEETGEYVDCVSGIELTGFIKNPHFYTYKTVNGDALTNESCIGWSVINSGGLHLRDGDFIASATRPVANSILNNWMGDYNVWQVLEELPVGIYEVYFRTRTSAGNNGVNEKTGRPDKFMWASVAEGDTLFTAFTEGGSWIGHPTSIKNVTVGEGTALSMGLIEHYTSGKNIDATTGEDKGDWATNTFADEARIFLVAPLAGFDYAKAAADGIKELKASEVVSREFYTLGGVRVANLQKGLNIVKEYRADGNVVVRKVLVR